MVHILVLEAAHDLHDGVHFADVRQKLVAESLARTRAFDQAGDIHKLDRRRNNHPGLGNALQHLQARIRHRHDADVGVDGAEGIVGSLRFTRACDCIEQCGLAHVGQSDDTGS